MARGRLPCVIRSSLSREPLRILVWAQLACAQDLELAKDEIEMIERLGSRDDCIVRVERDRPWAEIAVTIQQFEPTVFHFIGHGKRGSLVALDFGTGGLIEETRISPQRLVTVLRSAGTSIQGAYLNGCDTAQWAPHLLPKDGWLIGSITTLSDDLGGFFAPTYYQHLCDGLTNSEAFDRTQQDVALLTGSVGVPLVRWVEDPDPCDFLYKVFCRQAFQAPVLHEGSLLDLGDALDGVRRALSTNALATRVDVVGSSTVLCTDPLDTELTASLKLRLGCVEFDYRQLRKEFPQVVQFADAWMFTPFEERGRLMALADRLDDSRNQLLIAVNDHLPADRQLPMISRSSAIHGAG